MKKNSKYNELAQSIIPKGSLAQKAISTLISVKSSMYLFFSGVFVSIAGNVALNSINISYIIENWVYIILHFLLIILSFLATIILAYIANLAQKINVTIAQEYCRLQFDVAKAIDKKNEFENSLKNSFGISNDPNNDVLSRKLKTTYILRAICFVIAPICVILIIIMSILNNCLGGVNI